MEKENRKHLQSQYAHVNGNRRDANYETVFNSTAKSHMDFYNPNETADMSTISCISVTSTVITHRLMNPEIQMPMAPASSAYPFSSHCNPAETQLILNSTDLNLKQVELDCLYLQYLNMQYMNLASQNQFKEDQDSMAKDMLELHRADRILAKSIADLEREDKLLDNLTRLMQFFSSISKFIDENDESLKKFKNNYKRLVDLCNKARNYISISNIHIDKSIDFEETLSSELSKTNTILTQIDHLFGDKKLNLPPNFDEADKKIDVKLLDDLYGLYDRWKELVIKYHSLRAMNDLNERI